MRRTLIVNADDFGQSAAINRGIARCHEDGIVTSASLLVRWPAADEAAAFARRNRRLSIGLHVDLGAWVQRDGSWEPIYERVALDDVEAVGRELDAQLDAFRDLVGRGPTHVDSHQHVHLSKPAAKVFRAFASRLDIPLRQAAPAVDYCGRFYGRTHRNEPYPQAITVDGLIETMRALPDGVTELACHPGDGERLDSYADERTQEMTVLCDPRIREVLSEEGIELRSFAEL